MGTKKRKTISVEYIRNKVNFQLLNTPDDMKETRETLQILIETILCETGNYKGFRKLTPLDMVTSDFGITPGINADVDEPFKGTDHTRVFYY